MLRVNIIHSTGVRILLAASLALLAGLLLLREAPLSGATGSFQLTSSTYSATEGSPITVTVTRTGGCDVVNVQLTITSGTAMPGVHYVDPGIVFLTFGTGPNPCDTTRSYSIATIENLIVDGTRNFTATISVPAGSTLGAPSSATLSIIDNDGPGVLSFSAANYNVNENAGNATLVVNRSGGVSGTVTVNYATSDGSALAGLDYTATANTLTFLTGETTKNILIPITNDLLVESSELFNVTLSGATGGASIVGTNPATVTILDNDGSGQVQFAAASYSVNETAGFATIGLVRVNGSAGTVSVTCTTSDVTAFAPGDYQFTSQVVTFGPGVTAGQCTVPIVNDFVAEPSEQFNVTLSNPVGTTIIGPNPVSVTILDSGFFGGTYAFSAPQYTVLESAVFVTITVTRNTAAGSGSVAYSTSQGSALAGLDYVPTTGTLTFLPGDFAESFTVQVYNRPFIVGNRSFQVALGAPVGGTLGSPSVATVTIQDDLTAGGVIPIVSSLAPPTGPVAGGTAVTITGLNFLGTVSVTFGTTTAAYTVLSNSQIIATAPAAVGPGSVDVRVTNAAGVSTVTPVDLYTYLGTLPFIGGINPTSGSVDGGTVVTISGGGFTGALTVTFGGVSATFTIVSDTQIRATSPRGAAGSVDIRVTGPGGTSVNTALDDFTYVVSGNLQTYALTFRWSLLSWSGINGMAIVAALQGTENPDSPMTNNVYAEVTAVFTWDGPNQLWLAFFPSGVGIPGANDITVFVKGAVYWIAKQNPGTTSWTVLTN